MGSLKTIVFTVLILAALYFAGQQIGMLSGKLDMGAGSTLERVGTIDSGYGVGKDLLVPGKPEDIKEYEAGLRALPLRTEEEMDVVLLKLGLVEMQKAVQDFGARITQITSGPTTAEGGLDDCSGGPALNAAYNSALLHANNSLAMAKDAGRAKGFGYMGTQDFGAKINSVKKVLSDSMDKYNVLC